MNPPACTHAAPARRGPSPAYELVVFDWDGTLMDSAGKIVNCFAAAAADVGLAFPGEAAVRNVIGLGLQEAMDALFPGEDPRRVAALVARYREHFLHLDRTPMPLFPGVAEGLRHLAGLGLRLAVATGKSRRGLQRVLEATGLETLFCASRCADEAGSKPHPRMLQEILAQTRVAPARALMVGDTVYDLEMAARAGMPAAAVSYGVHDRRRLEALAPVACHDSFVQLQRWLAAEVAGQ